jgi:hypothetical protein
VLNRRKVSQERVIGISFVDILIQAVFLLLLILMVGYVDPVDQDKFKYFEAGKDLCNKLNKDSPKSCVEFIKDKDIFISKPALKLDPAEDFCAKRNLSLKDCKAILDKMVDKLEPSEDFCSKRKLSLKDCKSTLDKMAENIDLFPCIPPSSTSQLTRSIFWTLRAPGEIQFDRFSDEYMKYLKKEMLLDKINKAESIVSQGRKIYSPSEVVSTFSFMKEETCFHEYLALRPGKFSDADLAKEFEAIRSLRK